MDEKKSNGLTEEQQEQLQKLLSTKIELKVSPDEVTSVMEKRGFYMIDKLPTGTMMTFTNCDTQIEPDGPDTVNLTNPNNLNGRQQYMLVDVYLSTNTYSIKAVISPGIVHLSTRFFDDIMNNEKFANLYKYISNILRRL